MTEHRIPGTIVTYQITPKRSIIQQPFQFAHGLGVINSGRAHLGSCHLGCPMQLHSDVGRLDMQDGSLTWLQPLQQDGLRVVRLLTWQLCTAPGSQLEQPSKPGRSWVPFHDLTPVPLHGFMQAELAGPTVCCSSCLRPGGALRTLLRPDLHSPTPCGAEGLLPFPKQKL